MGADIPENNQRLTPCHDVRKSCHHFRSSRNSELRRIGWSRVRKQQRRSGIHRKKVRSGQTTLAAWWRWPIRDSSWRLLHHRLVRQDWSSRPGDGRSDPVNLIQFPRLPNEWMGQCIGGGEGEGQVNDRWPAKTVNFENNAENQPDRQ